MKKKFKLLILSIFTILILCSCTQHKHTYEEEWTIDSVGHWHKPTCEHVVMGGYAMHTYTAWEKNTETGMSHRTCTVCGYEEVKRTSLVQHTHSYSTLWSSDDVNHWHASTCGHDVVSDKEAHTYGDYIVDKEASESEEGSKHRVCSVCGHINTVTIPKVGFGNDVVSTGIYSGTYYDSITDSMLSDAATLKTTLNTIINKDYKHYSYSSAQTQLKTIDSYDGYSVECIYTGERLEKEDAWDREHVWAKSYGFNDESYYDAYTDMHHLRVSEHSINVNRSSSYFDEVDSPTNTDSYGNKWTSLVFEPRDEVKGDIARMLFYMTVKYDDPEKLDLELTDDVNKINASASVFGGYMPDISSFSESKQNTYKARKYVGGTAEPTVYLGVLSTLLKWHYEDPVDAREISRNNSLFTIQKNRNPFIDHPEYAYYLYQNESSQFININDLNTYASTYQNYNEKAIADINAKIETIGTVSLNSKALLDEIQNDYDNLGEVSKSFVTKYNVFAKAKDDYQKLYDSANQNNTIATEFSLKGINAKTGTKASNGIEIEYSGANFHTDYGIYATMSKANSPTNATIKAKGVYSTAKYIKLSWSNNNNAGTATVTVTSSTTSNTVSVSNLAFKKTTSSDVYVDISSLLKDGAYGDLTITIQNDAAVGASNSLRISAVAFTLTNS